MFLPLHRRSLTSAVVTAFLGLLPLGSPAEAETPLPTSSAAGGNPVRQDCDPGSYVVGFKARAGDWMDQISIVCGHWDEWTQRLQPAAQGMVKGPLGDSPGGEEVSASCPDGWAVSAYEFRMTFEEFFMSGTAKSGRPKFLHALRFYCRPALAGSGQTEIRTIGSSSGGNVSQFMGPFICPPREMATAMYGRAGLFVDAMGLICNLRPEPAAVGVESKVLDGSVIAEGTGSGMVLAKKPVGDMVAAGGSQTATVIADVDVYDAPGGGNVKGVLRSNNKTTKVSLLAPCQNNWCHVQGEPVPTGQGWIYSGTPPDFQSISF